MKKIILSLFIVSIIASCNTKSHNKNITTDINSKNNTLTYPYTAAYSSDLTISSHPEYAQKVLTVWKLYENKQIAAMKPYYADTVTYDDANGNHYYGPAAGLLEIAGKEMEKLDSLRFDISMWENIHSNDKNEDWVNIWCKERDYPKIGKADTSLMYEQWKIKNGRIYYFNQYYAKLSKN